MEEPVVNGMAEILAGATQFLTWITTSFTALTTWVLGDDLAFTYIAVFFISVAVGFLFRVLRSVQDWFLPGAIRGDFLRGFMYGCYAYIC